MFYVFGEIEVVRRVRAADVVLFPIAVLGGIDLVVGTGLVGAAAAGIGAHPVVDFGTAVEAEDEADVIVSQILDLSRVEEHAVGRQGQFEDPVVDLFLFTDVFDGLFNDAEVHQRFAAEEVDFAVLALAFGTADQEVYGILGYVEAH